MSTRITDLPQAETLNGSEVMPLVQNGVTKHATLDFINQAAPAALILQQTQQAYANTVVLHDETEALKTEFEAQYLGSFPAPPVLNNDGSTLTVGAIYWNTSISSMYVWNGAEWTAFSSPSMRVHVQRFSGDGIQTDFLMTLGVSSASLVDVFIDGIYQNKNTFTVEDTLISFSEPPPSGTENVEVLITVATAIGETDASLVSYKVTDDSETVRNVQSKLREWVSVKDFGAVGDGVTDDTAAIQAALNSLTQYSTLYFPSGRYRVSSTLTLRTSYVSIIGAGSGATTILRANGDYGDTFLISPTNPATDTFLLSVTMRGIKIRANAEMNSGAHLRLSEVTQSQFSDVFLEDGFVGLRIEGVRNTHFDGIKIESGKFFTTTKVGSRFVLIEDSPKASQENTEIFFDSFNWTFTVNATVEYGLELKEADGIWFSNGHILGAATGGCLLNLASSPQMVGAQFDNVWFDGFTETNVVIFGTPTGKVKEINFNSCTFSGSTQYAVWATPTAVFDDISYTGCSFTSSDGLGVRINSGGYWSFTGCDFTDINRAGSGNSYAIKVLVDTTINVVGGHIGKITGVGDELDYGIEIDTAGTKFNINCVSFWNIQVNEVVVPTTAELKGWVGNCTTDRANFNHVTLVSNAAVVPAIANSAYISGTGPINTMAPTWEGREVLLVGNEGSFTIAHNVLAAGQFLINGNTNVTLLANRGKQFRYFDTLNSWLDVK